MDPIDRAALAFRRALRVPFREDAALGDDLAAEARPVLDALSFGIAAAPDDPGALEHREALAMGALLGRRAALLRATPSVALAMVEAIDAALREIDRAPSTALIEALRAVIVEGYCAAIEERVQTDAARRAAETLVPQRIAPHCWLVIVSGEHAADALREGLDRAGRTLLDGDARACLVHVALTIEPTEDVAAELFGFDATARLVGAQCIFTNVSPAWRAIARDPEHLVFAPSFEEALRRGLALAGSELREPSAIVQRLRRLLGPSA